MRKYSLLRQRILAEGIVPPERLCVPDAATDEQILRCHEQAYLDKVKSGALSEKEIRRIGFPWSPQLVERSRRSTGATIGACLSAITDGAGVNLAGGTHHACTDHGEGFCVFNDAAIAAREMQARGHANRVLIVDCDVHQGNGTAQITQGDPSIFTLSIHGEKNFPFRKFASDIDIGLPDGVTDDDYLDMLEEGLHRALFIADPDLVIYVSGADPFVGDRLGKLAITKHGLQRRDRFVLETLRQRGIPVAVVMGGGYARNVDDIVDIHIETVRIASQLAEIL